MKHYILIAFLKTLGLQVLRFHSLEDKDPAPGDLESLAVSALKQINVSVDDIDDTQGVEIAAYDKEEDCIEAYRFLIESMPEAKEGSAKEESPT